MFKISSYYVLIRMPLSRYYCSDFAREEGDLMGVTVFPGGPDGPGVQPAWSRGGGPAVYGPGGVRGVTDVARSFMSLKK